MNFSGILKAYKPYNELLESINNSPISVSGIEEAAQGQLVYSLQNEYGGASLVVCYSDMEAKSFYEGLQLYTDNAAYFPSKEYVFYNIETKDFHCEHKRLKIADRLLHDENIIVVSSIDALMQYALPPEILRENSIDFKPGMCFELEELAESLVKIGYVRVDMVEGIGQFALRGGILDVFSPNCENPYRIEFFDNETDSIRIFDRYSQRTLKNELSAHIIPVTELVITDKIRDRVISEIKKRMAEDSENEYFCEISAADIDKLAQQRYFPAEDKYVELINGNIPSLIDYFKENDRIFTADPKRICERGKAFEREKAEIVTELKEKGIIGKNRDEYFFGYDAFMRCMEDKTVICMEALTHTQNDFHYKSLINFLTKTTVSFHGKIDYLCDDLKKWQENKYTVIILSATRARAENLSGVLNDRGIQTRLLYDSDEFNEGHVYVMRGNLKKGFEYPDIRFVVVSDSEIFEQKKKKERRRRENTDRIKSYNDINPGDYVVHTVHGIGEYKGMQKMTVGGVTKDYFKIQYRGTDCLYVPIEQMNLLYKYIGGNEDNVLKLNKLGGNEWKKTKAKVKASTDELASKLIKLYAERENIKGFAYSGDTPWQRDFEDRFPYQETEDQLRSIEEVKEDMEKPKPMDRLLCGDVGFGKTEVALRAAFKAINDSKQVAYLCPTTILAMQHYETFSMRMAGFPVKVEMLSRFRTAAQQKRILKQLKSGEVDIIIGTHRMLSKDVKFKDLGLLIIDEEQRFGVAHKERLKELKNNIDVLTMTATPIPRTLHMAMTSVRDMSVLAEPPENRYPVQTFVLEYNENVILDAVRNELSRGGQVFYLYNRVDGIYQKANRIKEMIPGINIAVGHGRMNEDELEEIMYDMAEGRTDVLVCTTIIETGLDIPNANTMIIENADRMGLAQLYQLRGRVGRSNRAAYAYLTYRPDSILSEVASKRLRAIKEFTEFGSGFRIAMRDLEIRGAGNILGGEQHGHMDSVGYDMYCKLLQDSINKAKGIETKSDVHTTMDIEVNAYLPESYIQSGNQRIDMYKKIAAIENEEDRREIEDELIDRYGDIPKCVMNIISAAYLKARAEKLGIEEISQHGTNMTVKFLPRQLDITRINAMQKKYGTAMRLMSQTEPIVSVRLKEGNRNILQIVNDLLNILPVLDDAEK